MRICRQVESATQATRGDHEDTSGLPGRTRFSAIRFRALAWLLRGSVSATFGDLVPESPKPQTVSGTGQSTTDAKVD